MTPLTDAEREELTALLATGNPLPEKWLHRLFPNGPKAESAGKEYRLVYDGNRKQPPLGALSNVHDVVVRVPAAVR